MASEGLNLLCIYFGRKIEHFSKVLAIYILRPAHLMCEGGVCDTMFSMLGSLTDCHFGTIRKKDVHSIMRNLSWERNLV